MLIRDPHSCPSGQRFLLYRRFTLFPRLRASADLLMMPKEVLADRSIRVEVVPTLSVPRISAILKRFRPDDYAPDPLPHGAARFPLVANSFRSCCHLPVHSSSVKASTSFKPMHQY